MRHHCSQIGSEAVNFTPGEARDFWTKVDMNGPRKPWMRKRCWIWKAFINNKGYANISFRSKKTYAHIVSYLIHKGPIPEGLEIDHKCRTTNCIRPSHLQAVTHRENMLRGNTIVAIQTAKTHCLRGHPLSGENLYIYADHRGCLTCRRIQSDSYNKSHRKSEPA